MHSSTFATTLTILFLLTAQIVHSQRNSRAIQFWPSRCDSCKPNTPIYKSDSLDWVAQYNNLKYSNVAANLDTALFYNDKRIIAIVGYGIIFPGKSDKGGKSSKIFEKHLEKYGYKIIMGTSDDVDPTKPMIQKLAYDYAERYNLLLLKRLTNPDK